MEATRLLVVDDQPDIRMLLDVVLSAKGYDVTTAKGGPEALELLAIDVLPELILLDVQMPDVDGWDTLAAIRGRHGPNGRAL
jgi:CheY-like chemotaxis protein